MIQFILMLLGLVFTNGNANTTANLNNDGQATVQTTNSGDGVEPGEGGPVSGNSGQTPPPFTQP